ncbi:MAG: rhodanese-like domain-containing protein [Deltaproteobacteria bacterium]|nr:rhodanese-like domain-containing protein [Deltaproteobacteria bacterium]
MLQRKMFYSTLKGSLLILLVSTVLGGFLNHELIGASMNGKLLKDIGQKQITDLMNKAGGIPFIALKEAKKIFDEGGAVFLDSRSSADYRESHIKGALELPLVSLVQNQDLAGKIIPDKAALYIVYCDGEGCDLSVELAKELIALGYFNIRVFGEGYPGWAEARYPIQSSL